MDILCANSRQEEIISMSYPEYERDIAYCREIHKKYGKSFYFGTLILSKDQRDATCALYAFFRFPDEYVDTYFRDQKDIALEKLERWKALWKACYEGIDFDADEEERMIVRATKYIFDTYKIPYEYSQAFLAAMVQDTHKERYETYQELEGYMYGSAVVVGLMMVHILCAYDERFKKDSAYKASILGKAGSLGEAFQMTNFLRDVGEDMKLRQRIYIPKEDMIYFGVSEKDIQQGIMGKGYTALMKFEIDRTEKLYKKADEGISMLPSRAGKGIRVARVLYSKILTKIENKGYDVFSSRIKLSLFEKIILACKTLSK